MKKIYEVPSVVRALAILEFLGSNHVASFEKIYTQLGIPKSSAYQMLSTLESRGYVRRASGSIEYGLGLRLFELGNLAVSQLDIRAEAIPILRDLMLKTKQTCNLGILDGTEVVYLVKIESPQLIRLNSWEGKRIPPHSTAMGKILLAWKEEADIDEILEKTSLTANTERTITDPKELRKHLLLVRERGWALDDQENEPDIRCVGAPVISVSGKVIAAISVSGLSTRLNDAVLPQISTLVQDAGRQLSRKIGTAAK
jgi:DNA-binding IclR family transcriptional regulator